MFFFRKKSKPANSGSYAVLVRGATEDELQGERRLAPRQDCNLPAWCDPVADYGHLPWVTLVTEISANGLAFLANRRFEPGTILAILPPSKDIPGNLLAHVIQAREAGSGRWIMGCRLAFPLREEEIRTLLGTWQVARNDSVPAQ